MSQFRSLFCFGWLIAVFCFAQVETDSINTHLAIGDSLNDLGDHESALKAYLTVITLDSLNYTANWKTGDQYTEIAKNLPEDMKEQKEENFDLARQYCEKAIAIDSSGWEGHTYLSIALGRLALFRGGKEKINLSKRIKAEADMGIALNPDNDIAYHVIGVWHRNLANLSWILKSFAKILYGGVPPGSNEEAVKALKKAIEINPDHINHYLELAKTYKEMGKKELMKEPLDTVLELPVTEPDDDQHKEEAKKLLEAL